MRRLLDRLYHLALWLSALCLVAIAVMVALQLAGRMVDGALRLAGARPYGFVILSLAEFAAYLLAAASFLALAGTLKAGAHIRVMVLLANLGARARRIAEAWAFAAAAVFCSYATWHIGAFTYYSWSFNEVSPGMIAVPLAIPQAAMTAGILILTIALVDEFVTVLRRGDPTFRASEDALTLGKEG
jgi:TRAP-type C4-dicarboxylate transport system permease small subunit